MSYFTSASTSAYLATHSSFAQLACRVIMIASLWHDYALGKRKGSTLGERPLPFWHFVDSNVLPYITLRFQTYQALLNWLAGPALSSAS